MAGYTLKIKTRNGQKIINNLTQDTTIKELKSILANLANIPINKLHVLSGFPPKNLDISLDGLTLSSIGIISGETLILEEKEAKDNVKNTNEIKLGYDSKHKQHVEQPFDCPGILMKQIVPSDNSCLFNSIGFVLNGAVDESGTAAQFMRQLVAETIKTERQEYNEAILGKPVEEYCSWIQQNTSWGGAIELSILASYFGIEIAVVDTTNAIINCFGEDLNFPHRVFLLFDGIHYDPLYMEPSKGGNIQTIFQKEDEGILNQANQIAKEANSSRQFTDVNKFTLKCMVCNILLKGQIAAQEHAQTTGHANFGEV